VVNLAAAADAALFAQASLQFYLRTHSLIGGAFLVERTWFVIAFLIRRPPGAVSRKPGSWLLAFGGTFAGVLFRPVGAHSHWGVVAGLGLQLADLTVCIMSLLALGRSFGFVAADRGLVTHSPYAVVRHPVYAWYLLIRSAAVGSMHALDLRPADRVEQARHLAGHQQHGYVHLVGVRGGGGRRLRRGGGAGRPAQPASD
jgi:hypothetical protein